MRQSKEEKARTHERIVEIAAARIREEGIDRPGVAEIMQAAGLTHGGFYKHFGSRDELVAEAAEHAFAGASRKIHRLTHEGEDPLATFVDWYVSTSHRDDPSGGCPVAAFIGDVRRADERVRGGYRTVVEEYIEELEPLLDDGGEDARRQATIALSTLVGALTLARAIDDETLSTEILDNVRDAIKQHRTDQEHEQDS